MKTKILNLFLLLAISIGTMFAEKVQIGDLYYELNTNNLTASVAENLYHYVLFTDIVIPASITYQGLDYRVTSIENNAFKYCTGLTSVTIPNSITSIGSYAFSDCSGLTKVNITDIAAWCNISLSNISSNPLCFAHHLYVNDVEVTNLVIPNSVTSIRDYSFYNCSGLTSVTIPNSVSIIGEGAFFNCTGLRSVTIPNSVTSIGNQAFRFCSGLTSPVYNARVFAFMPTSCLGTYTIPNGIESIAGSAFYYCTGLTSVTIPNSVTSIGNSAFSGCTGLASVIIPNSVTSIGEYAFSRVPNVVYSGNATGSPWGARSANGFVDGSLIYADASKTALLACFTTIEGNLIIPNSITSIGQEAFYHCTGLTSVTIPNSVTSIESGTFIDCSGLTSVTIPNSVTSIGNSAFDGCSGLTSVTIPNSVTSIGEFAFAYCSGLTSVTIGNSVTSIGNYAFRDCSGLTFVVWNAKNCMDFKSRNTPFYHATIGYDLRGQITSFTFGVEVEHIPAFICSGMSNLNSITIPSGVASIGENAFEDCSGLTSVRWNAKNCNSYNFGDKVASFIFGDEVEVIPASLCSGMKRLSSIRIPVKVKSIGKDAFKGCDSIASVIWNAKNGNSYNFGPQVESFLLGKEVESIPNSLCSGMSQLTSMEIPNSVKTIGNDAFKGCGNLQTLTLGENITSYGSSAFSGCSALTSIYNYRRTPVALSADVFKNVDYFACTLYVMEGSVDMYKSDRSSWKDFFYNIEPISATSTTSGDDIQITPTDNTANIVWPQVNGADTYELVIKDKSGNIICTLIFNAQGQLTSIAFSAPSRNNVPQQTQTAGFAFTVTGLNSGTNYDLVMTSKNSNGGTIQTKTVSFTTTGNAQSVENILDGNAQSTKIFRNGQIYILRGEKTYTLQGQEVK